MQATKTSKNTSKPEANGKSSRILTKEEEVQLARTIRAGGKEGDKAKAILVERNLGLVHHIAKRYFGCGLDIDDIIQEGCAGLAVAAERFQPEKFDTKFGSYAAFWIKAKITRALSNHSREIRLPVHLGQDLARIRRVSADFEAQIGREPSDEELAYELKFTLQRVARLRTVHTQRPLSLDAPLGFDRDSALVGETIPDQRGEDRRKRLEHVDEIEHILHLVNKLPEREKLIIVERFGLGGEEPKTRSAIASRFQITGEAVRQIETKVLRSLRRKAAHLHPEPKGFGQGKTVPASSGKQKVFQATAGRSIQERVTRNWSEGRVHVGLLRIPSASSEVAGLANERTPRQRTRVKKSPQPFQTVRPVLYKNLEELADAIRTIHPSYPPHVQTFFEEVVQPKLETSYRDILTLAEKEGSIRSPIYKMDILERIYKGKAAQGITCFQDAVERIRSLRPLQGSQKDFVSFLVGTSTSWHGISLIRLENLARAEGLLDGTRVRWDNIPNFLYRLVYEAPEKFKKT